MKPNDYVDNSVTQLLSDHDFNQHLDDYDYLFSRQVDFEPERGGKVRYTMLFVHCDFMGNIQLRADFHLLDNWQAEDVVTHRRWHVMREVDKLENLLFSYFVNALPYFE